MRGTVFMAAVLIIGCVATKAQAQTVVCDQKALTEPCIDQPLAGADKVTGKATAGASLIVKVGGKTIGSTTAKADGTFNVTVSPLIQGQSVEVEQTTAPTGSAGAVAVGVQAPAKRTMDDVRVEGVAADGTYIDVMPGGETVPEHFLVNDVGLQARAKDLQKGDHLSVVVVQQDDEHVLQSFHIKASMVIRSQRILVLLASALVLFLFSLFFTKGDLRKLILGEDNRYSNSKFQMVLWWVIAITTYMATVALRFLRLGPDFFGHVNIPQNLFLLSGMSALTFGAAKGITAGKASKAKDAANAEGTLGETARQGSQGPNVATGKKPGDDKTKTTAKDPNFFTDLTSNDKGDFDLGDFQMLAITLLAVVSYMLLMFHFLGSIQMRVTVSLPDVDTTILAAFGLGQGAYLTKKAAGPLGET